MSSWNLGLKKPHLTPRPCPTCGQLIPLEVLTNSNEQRKRKIESALQKRLEGKLPVGRPKKRNDAEIHALRAKGLSLRKIAKATGFSLATIQSSLREMREQYESEKHRSDSP